MSFQTFFSSAKNAGLFSYFWILATRVGLFLSFGKFLVIIWLPVARYRVVRIMIQAMPKMLKIKVIRVTGVSRWLTMTFLPFREVLTRSYTTKSHNNGRNPLKTRFYPNFDEIAQIGVRYGAFTKRLQRDPLIISKSIFRTTQETSGILFSLAIQYFYFR